MLRKTTLKLSVSILGFSVLGFFLSLFIVITFGSIGAKQDTKLPLSSSASSTPKSSSAVLTSSQETRINGITYSKGGIIDSAAGRFFLGSICFLITQGLVYSAAWREGNRDPNRVKYGHMNKFMAKGTVAGLISQIPNAILTVLMLATISLKNNMFAIIVNAIYRVVNIQFVVFGDEYLNLPLACFLLLLIVPVFTGLGYFAGWNNFSILSKVVYKTRKNNSKQPNKK